MFRSMHPASENVKNFFEKKYAEKNKKKYFTKKKAYYTINFINFTRRFERQRRLGTGFRFFYRKNESGKFRDAFVALWKFR